MLNLVCHGPIERGLDMSRGGVDIVNFACDATALATTANSLAAIEQRVVKEKRLTWEQLVTVLKNDFEGAEDIRLMLKSVPQYGAGGTAADRYAKYLADLYTHMMRDTPTRDGFIVLPGIFSHGDVYIHGTHLGATPNGRHAGGPISHSADPDPGFLPGGGTALIDASKEVAKLLAQTNGDIKTGVAIVLRALEEPVRQIAVNAGVEGSVVVEKVKSKKSNTFGYDAAKNDYGDMIERGIADPTKVTRSALQNAASVAAMVLTTESLVSDLPEKNPPAAAPQGGGMGGMY